HTRWPRDWSSDVCSSDLLGLCLITRPLFVALECFFVILPTPQWRLRIFALAFASFRCSTFGTTHFGRVNGGGGGDGGGGGGGGEIGRASCRERVEMGVGV